MMSPLVMLKRRSSVIIHRLRKVTGPIRNASPGSEKWQIILGWPSNITTGFTDCGRGLVARDDFVNAEEIFRIVLALRLRLADKGGRHQLMVALAVIDLVRLQLDVVGQLEILERGCELDRVGGLFP